MSRRQSTIDLPFPFEVRSLDRAGVRVRAPEASPVDFELVVAPSLTERVAAELVEQDSTDRPLLVSYCRSTGEGRRALREAGVSYVGDDGRVFLRARGIYLDRDDRVERRLGGERAMTDPTASATRNPFAIRGSRVVRWLLLHHQESHSVSEMAAAVDLSPPVVSRVLRALHDAALIDDVAVSDARRREVVLTRPRDLLEAWLPLWQRRRFVRRSWDIGAADADEALAILERSASGPHPGRWAIGGIAGAASVRRSVEPADVAVWVAPDEVEALMEVFGAEPVRHDRLTPGDLRVLEAPDPWVLGLAKRDGLPVADSVQLWLDCASGGERGLDAAEAIAEAMRW